MTGSATNAAAAIKAFFIRISIFASRPLSDTSLRVSSQAKNHSRTTA
jgi:hypothetical protein